MVHYMECLEYGTSLGKIDDLLDGISLGKEYGTVLGSSVRVVDVEVNI